MEGMVYVLPAIREPDEGADPAAWQRRHDVAEKPAGRHSKGPQVKRP